MKGEKEEEKARLAGWPLGAQAGAHGKYGERGQGRARVSTPAVEKRGPEISRPAQAETEAEAKAAEAKAQQELSA